jgi:hypothetical protein
MTSDTEYNSRDDRFRRERLLLRYAEAILDGDLDTQARLMEEAAAFGDTELEEAIWELHAADGESLRTELESERAGAMEQDAELVRHLLDVHFQGRVLRSPWEAAALTPDTADTPPLTVGDVAASLRADLAREFGVVPPREREAVDRAFFQLEANAQEPIPERVTPRGIRSLLARLGADAGRWFERQFHEATAHLTAGRSGHARLAAARRARAVAPPPLPRPPQAPEEKEGTNGTSGAEQGGAQ